MKRVPMRAGLTLDMTPRVTGASALTLMLAPSCVAHTSTAWPSARAPERLDADIAYHEVRRKADQADEDAAQERCPEVVHAVGLAEEAGKHQHQRVDHEQEEAEGEDRQR